MKFAELRDSAGRVMESRSPAHAKPRDSRVLLGVQPIVDLRTMDVSVQALLTSLEINRRELVNIVEGLRLLPEVQEFNGARHSKTDGGMSLSPS